jgi:hypothetical protein
LTARWLPAAWLGPFFEGFIFLKSAQWQCTLSFDNAFMQCLIPLYHLCHSAVSWIQKYTITMRIEL